MVKMHTKYVLLDGCGTARLASPSVSEAIEQLTEKLAPTAYQEFVGCPAGSLVKAPGARISTLRTARTSVNALAVVKLRRVKSLFSLGPLRSPKVL